MTNDRIKLSVRISPTLRAELEESRQRNGRTLTDEVVTRLRDSFEPRNRDGMVVFRGPFRLVTIAEGHVIAIRSSRVPAPRKGLAPYIMTIDEWVRIGPPKVVPLSAIDGGKEPEDAS
jgi:hypothetical protein